MRKKAVIVGRQYELLKLEKAYQSKRSEFIAVYGRRRIGKTYVIRNFFSSKDCTYFQSTGIHKAKGSVQRKEFMQELQNVFYPGSAKLEVPKSWMSIFQLLTEIIERQNPATKIVLFFDEFPWMAIRSSKLLEALEYYWNRYWVNIPNLKLIVCGSAASWMLRNIIKNKGGLHNRVTLRLPMEPFSLAETKAFLEYEGIKYNPHQILQIYMCIGGIPYYLTMLDKGLSAAQNINQLCFRKKGTLLDEFEILFSSLFTESEMYEALVRMIAEKREGISRTVIEKKMKYKGGVLTEKLKDLESAGFIASFIPWGRSKKGKYYKVIDEYTLFYLTWIEPHRLHHNSSELGNRFWEMKTHSAGWNAWAGYSFEMVCFKHLENIKKALKIPDDSNVLTWRYVAKEKNGNDQGAQIDLLFDRQDGVVSLCEIKYSQDAFKIDKEYARNLKNKEEIYQKVTKTKKQIFISMISPFGVRAGIYKDDLIDSSVTLNDFFE